MKLIFNYDNLMSALQEVSLIVEDSSVADDRKNVNIEVGTTAVKIIGVSNRIANRNILERDSYQLEFGAGEELGENESYLFSVRNKQLLNFLNTYKNLRKTRVDSVILDIPTDHVVNENTGRKILGGILKCIMIEVPIEVEEGEEVKVQRGEAKFNLLNIPVEIQKAVVSTIDESNLVDVVSESLMLYTLTLMPILEGGDTLKNYIHFDTDNVVALTNRLHVVIKNLIQTKGKEQENPFTQLRLHKKCINFLNKVLANADETVKVAKDNRYLYFKWPNNELSLAYEPFTVNYTRILEQITKNNGLWLDRAYLKDVLKRFSLSGQEMYFEVKPKERIIHLKSADFEQDLDMESISGYDGIEKITFRIMPSALTTCIIGDDDAFIYPDEPNGENIALYYDGDGSGDAAYISIGDVSDTWVSVLRASVTVDKN